MQCGTCNGDSTVLETRVIANGLRRRRRCLACGGKFTTVELRAEGGQRSASCRFVLLDRNQMRRLQAAAFDITHLLALHDDPQPHTTEGATDEG